MFAVLGSMVRRQLWCSAEFCVWSSLQEQPGVKLNPINFGVAHRTVLKQPSTCQADNGVTAAYELDLTAACTEADLATIR